MQYLHIFSLAIILWIAGFAPARSEIMETHPSIGVIVEHEKELEITSEQARALQSLRLEMEKEALKKTAELKVAEIELSELKRGDAVDLGKIEAKLAQIDSVRTSLILAEIRAAEQAKSVLTAEQRKKLTFLSVPFPPSQGNLLESDLFKQIQAALKEQFKDQKIVEIETTQAVVSRLLDWAKFLGFFVGIPLALLGLVLGLLGVKTYTDFSRLITVAQEEVKKSLESAQTAAQAIKKEGDSLTGEYQALRSQLANVNTLSEEVKTLANKVKRIEEKIVFEPSATLSPDLQKSLESSLASFQEYFNKLGYEPKKGRIGVDVRAQVPGYAHYDGEKNQIVLSQAVIKDTDVAFREYTHHVLISFAKKLFGNWDPVSQAIESGLADYFPCSFNGDPALAEIFAKDVLKKPYIRNLENTRKFSELPPNPSSQDSGEIWGGAFWETRQLLGKERADSLLFSVWLATKPSEALGDPAANFVNKLVQMEQSAGGEKAEQIKSIFARRGLNL